MRRVVDGNMLMIQGSNKRLEIRTCIEGDDVFLELSGSVTAELENDLIDEILAFVSVGKNVKLDMKKMDHISSTCQKKLVEAEIGYVEKKGTTLELYNVTPRMYALFRSSRLDTQLRIRREE